MVDNIKEGRLIMKSFCIKTNYRIVLDYLLEKLPCMDLDNVYYSENCFKYYRNIIVHYTGEEEDAFFYELSNLLTECVFIFYKDILVSRILNYHYFYFDDLERKQIASLCIDSQEDFHVVWPHFLTYLLEHKCILLDGFVNFRLGDYQKKLEERLDECVSQFVVDREYNEFIDLLHMYIHSKPAETDMLHLIYANGESVLVDKHRKVVSVSDNTFSAKYLSDITFSSNDFALNSLLSLLPSHLEIHLMDEEDEFIHTLQLIFEDRVSICRNCPLCQSYRNHWSMF